MIDLFIAAYLSEHGLAESKEWWMQDNKLEDTILRKYL